MTLFHLTTVYLTTFYKSQDFETKNKLVGRCKDFRTVWEMQAKNLSGCQERTYNK